MAKRIEIEFDGDPMVIIDRGEATEKVHVGTDAYQFLNVCRTMAAIGLLAERVGPVHSVLEPFGGVGWHSRYIRKICKPTNHFAIDLSIGCVESMIASPALKGITATCADAWHLGFKEPTFDWVHVDCQEFTLMKFLKNTSYVSKGHGWRDLIDSLVPATKRYISITDSTIFGISRFQQNRDAYAERCGMDPDNWEDYWRVFSEVMSKRYDMSLVYVVWWSKMAASCLFEIDRPPGEIEVVHSTVKADIKILEVKEQI